VAGECPFRSCRLTFPKIFPLHGLRSLTAFQIMGDDVVFFRPVEKVGTVIDVLHSCKHATFPVVDPDDNSVLFGTMGRNALCVLLRERVFGNPTTNSDLHASNSVLSNYLEHDGKRYMPLVEWETVEGSYPKFPKVEDIRLNPRERECYVDLRPYVNTSPISVHEAASVNVSIFACLFCSFVLDSDSSAVVSCLCDREPTRFLEHWVCVSCRWSTVTIKSWERSLERT
jgi:hypothetical protein